MSTGFPTAPLAFRYTERAAAPWKSLSLRLTHKNSDTPAVIPSRSHRLVQRPLDEHRYKSRNLIERFFCRIIWADENTTFVIAPELPKTTRQQIGDVSRAIEVLAKAQIYATAPTDCQRYRITDHLDAVLSHLCVLQRHWRHRSVGSYCAEVTSPDSPTVA